MRDIKLRAWNTETNEIITKSEDIQLFYESDNGLHCGGISENGDWENYPLMQFTGLKDKNGVDIYEGDILDWNAKEWGEPYQEVVEWDYELFSVRKNDWSEWCEVIGNIHQNKDLLVK